MRVDSGQLKAEREEQRLFVGIALVLKEDPPLPPPCFL
jgi:hypothetical protein